MSLLRIPGLDHTDQNTLDKLVNQLEAKSTRNQIRAQYYDGKNALRDLGISIPPGMKRVETVLGWPAKAVDVLSRRCNLDGFVIPGASADDLGITDLWSANNMEIEAPQAHTSAFIHATAFVATTLGDVQSGEPDVLITARAADTGTGLWDPRKRRLSAALSIVDKDDSGQVIDFVLYLPDRVLTCTRGAGNVWRIDARAHSLGRVPVEPLVYKPRLGRPFGSSRISRAVMSLTDSAVRTVLRSEVSAEFYSSPQRWLMGADESAFVDEDGRPKSQWESILGRVWAIGPDEEGGPLPQVGQFPQASMQPHTDQLRGWAMLFAGETSITLSSLGIVQDNPASAEAIYAAKEELVVEAEAANDVFGSGWTRSVRSAYMMRNNLSTMPPELLGLRAKWRDPATPSKASASDAIVKQISVLPWLAESEVALEQLGYDATTIARIMADKKRAAGSQALTALTAAAQAARTNPTVAQLANRGNTSAG